MAKTYDDLMVDLETLGGNHNAPIVQIGACYFDRHTGKLGQTFEVCIDLKSSMGSGFKPDADTILWWLEQSKEVQTMVFSNSNTLPVREAFIKFAEFAENTKFVWSHATFDFVLLTNTYKMLGLRLPFHYKTARDLRTLTDLGSAKGGYFSPPQIGTSHNALDDCKFQVLYTVEYLKRLR